MSLRFFAKFTGKHLWRSGFLIKLQTFSPVTLLKRDSNTGAFREIAKFLMNTCFEELLRITTHLTLLRMNLPFLQLTLSLPVSCWAGHNTNLPSDSIISKMVRVNIPFATTFFKEYSPSFLTVCRLIDFAFVVLQLLMFKVCVIIGISKMEFFNFSGNERVNTFLHSQFFVDSHDLSFRFFLIQYSFHAYMPGVH